MAKLMLDEISEGMAVRTQAYLKAKKLLPFKNKPGSFLSLTLSDASGTLEAKIFNDAEAIAARLVEGRIVSISGKADSYQGALSLVLDAAVPEDAPVDPADFLPAYPGDVSALEARFDAQIASVQNPGLSCLLQSIFGDPEIRANFRLAPAAKGMHGAYLHGLLEHVTRVAEMVDGVCAGYPQVDRDLVMAGVLLHDIGKTVELTWNLAIDYAPIGRLHGHIIIGDRLVNARALEVGLNEETALRLSHIILSHHGTREFGAVTLPQTLEAIIVHGLDDLEAKATRCLEMLKTGNPEAPWSDYDRMHERFWYRGPAEVSRPR